MDIRHDLDARRFTAVIDGQDAGSLSYADTPDALDFQSVFTRPDFRGRGVAEAVTRAAFEYAKAQQRRVIPTCPYVRDTFLKRNPEFAALVA